MIPPAREKTRRNVFNRYERDPNGSILIETKGDKAFSGAPFAPTPTVPLPLRLLPPCTRPEMDLYGFITEPFWSHTVKTLSIKNVPDAIHRRLKQRAGRHHRSLNGELLSLLDEALDQDAQSESRANNLSEFLLASPLRDSELELERDRDTGREVVL